MKVSRFELKNANALHHLLEEAHVGRAATHLGITPAAASNALRRLRDELGDPLLVKKGRGLMRTRLGESLRGAARDVVDSAARLARAAAPYEPASFRGQLPIALSEHVAAVLLPQLDRLARERAPLATLSIFSIPDAVLEWLELTAGVLVSPKGAFAVAEPGRGFASGTFYEDRYVCAMRKGHPVAARRWDATVYARQEHVLVTPRGQSQRSDVDEQLEAIGLARRVARVVPSFTLALPIVAQSDLIVTVPERYARRLPPASVTFREVPLRLRPLEMRMLVHPAHANDARTSFIRELLAAALRAADREVSRPKLRRPVRRH